MKRILICAAALGLFASAPLYAQNNDHRDDKRGVAAPDRAQEERPAAQKEQQNQAPTGRAAVPQRQPVQPRSLPGPRDVWQGSPARPNAERAPNNMTAPGNAMQVKPPIHDRMGHSNQPAVNRGNRPDISALRRNMQAPQHFHSEGYRAPQGYRDRRWSYGERLPSGYFLRNYWITNFMMYGLFAPPADLIWVRVGNDALLIDRDSGDIVQVRYGVFY